MPLRHAMKIQRMTKMMTMHKTMPALLCLAALAACSHRNDASQENFTAGMNAYLARRGDLCLAKSSWPIDVTQREIEAGARNAVQMPALEKLGLVRSSVASVVVKDEERSATIKVLRYDLTDAGRAYYLTKEMRSQASDGSVKTRPGDFCAARLSLDKVTGWEPPRDVNGQQETVVSFTYKIDPAPWVRDAGIQKVFPVVARMVQGAGTVQLQEAFRLGPDGWVAKDL
jgi:hypothetical protein